jgi:hypothetical protein
MTGAVPVIARLPVGKCVGMAETMTVSVDGDDYLVQPEGDQLRIGRDGGGDTTWFDDTVPLSSLPPGARTAVESAQRDDVELVTALRGIVSAYSERGG